MSVTNPIGPRAAALSRAVTSADSCISALIAGEDGAGQEAVARRIAAAFLCLAPIDGEPCGECAACRSFSNDNCADVLHLWPCGSQELIVVGQVVHNDLHEQRKRAHKVPDQPILRDYLLVRALQARNKVVIISRAERMNNDAANALLKMVEEPPDYARFIFTTNAASKIIPTIRSRCVLIPCDFEELSPGLAATLSAGTPELASQLGAPEMAEFVSRFDAFLGGLAICRRVEALKVSEEFQDICKLYYKAAADDDDAERFSRAEVVRMFANWLALRASEGDIFSQRALGVAIEMHRATLGNVNFGYLCDSLFMASIP